MFFLCFFLAYSVLVSCSVYYILQKFYFFPFSLVLICFRVRLEFDVQPPMIRTHLNNLRNTFTFSVFWNQIFH
ncbi:hypothetical protein QBC32DRAFT_122300 [Pseudoneurospora amorphoporcata]|uniref:Uncharacterized protein n=1 Tax=Pseudoneurospora amorphoporcata TaxID=241081 RepID=A0AAN6NMF4_9PEZI|nr:hypothetical protein QBC32DRAFT_122300 [Pseudoneurospora amorphoporcata]